LRRNPRTKACQSRLRNGSKCGISNKIENKKCWSCKAPFHTKMQKRAALTQTEGFWGASPQWRKTAARRRRRRNPAVYSQGETAKWTPGQRWWAPAEEPKKTQKWELGDSWKRRRGRGRRSRSLLRGRGRRSRGRRNPGNWPEVEYLERMAARSEKARQGRGLRRRSRRSRRRNPSNFDTLFSASESLYGSSFSQRRRRRRRNP
jgi:hypothetical protein